MGFVEIKKFPKRNYYLIDAREDRVSLGARSLDILRTSGLLFLWLRTNTLIFNDGLTI